jgi:hypothetical protein
VEPASTESARPLERSDSPATWPSHPSAPRGARIRFALAAFLLLLWVAFLAYLAVVSGKRPEERERERQPVVGGRAAAAGLQPAGHSFVGSQAGPHAG